MTATQTDERAIRRPDWVDPSDPTVREAWFCHELDNGWVSCELCHHEGIIGPEKRCPCGARENRHGKLVTLNYGRLVACNVDEIEKRGLYHFHPGSLCLSVAAPGCNLRCQFCENWDLSQACKAVDAEPQGEYLSPGSTVRLADLHGCVSIAAAYTEPTVSFEYAFDTARQARETGLKSVWVTNGQIREEPLRMIAPYLDAASVDLKCFSEATYSRVCSGHLKPVLDNITLLRELGIHLEVSTPIIPAVNDSDEELRFLTGFLASVDPDLPWHVSRFHPDFKMEDVPMTSIDSMRRAREIGREAGLRYVYGSAPGCPCAHTYCHACGLVLVKRLGASVEQNRLVAGGCPDCGERLPGVGLDELTS